MKTAALSERGQAEEELIKVRNQARLEEVSKTRAVGLSQRTQQPAGLRWVLPILHGVQERLEAQVDLARGSGERRAQWGVLLDAGQV